MTTQELLQGLIFYNPLVEWAVFPKGTPQFAQSQGFGGNPNFYKSIKYYDNDGNKEWAGKSTLGHNGLDFACPEEAIVRPIVYGKSKIVWAGADTSGGIGVKLHSPHPVYPDYNIETIYWHHKENLVDTNQEVNFNTDIGKADNTGFSTGTHLHVGVRFYNTKQNENETAVYDWHRHIVDYYNGYFGYVDFKLNPRLMDKLDVQEFISKDNHTLGFAVKAPTPEVLEAIRVLLETYGAQIKPRVESKEL